MNLRVPQLLPNISTKLQDLLLRPPQHPSEQRQAHPLKPSIKVNKVPLPELLELGVLGPAVGRPSVDGLHNVLEACSLDDGLVLVAFAEGAADFAGSLDETFLPFHQRGCCGVEGTVIAEDGDLNVLDFVPAAWAEVPVDVLEESWLGRWTYS